MRDPVNYKGHSKWICRCSCGVERVVIGGNLRRGKSISCGHEARTAGGLWARYTSEYDSWRQIVGRCNNPGHPDYKNYGARNIWVCERWKSFENFIADMGRRPFVGAQIDRTDNDGPYSPDNCRWVDAKTNMRNSSATRTLEYGGLCLSIAEWGERVGIKPAIISTRLRLGWSVERALSQPPRMRPASTRSNSG